MPGKLAKDKQRISYAEMRDTVTALQKTAKARGVSVSHLIRQATAEWRKRCMPHEPQEKM